MAKSKTKQRDSKYSLYKVKIPVWKNHLSYFCQISLVRVDHVYKLGIEQVNKVLFIFSKSWAEIIWSYNIAD